MPCKNHILSLLAFFALLSPLAALVEPEVEAWQSLIAEVEESLPLIGTDIFPEALEEVGYLAGNVASAPLSDLMSELEQRRQLSFKYFTPWHVKNKRELRAFIRAELEKDYTPQKIDKEESMLKALGLVPPDFQVVSFMEDLLTDAVAGVYDPSADQFFLVDMQRGQSLGERFKAKATTGLLGDTTSVLIIHELDHALGGQHFPLRTTYEKLVEEASLDEQLAVMALVEGDATFVMIDHQSKTPAKSAGSKTFLAGTETLTNMLVKFPLPLPGMGKFSQAPLFFQKSLIFPYYTGAEFISQVRNLGGSWQDVNDCYTNLPHSTEVIFHPDRYKYLNREPRIPNFSQLPEPLGLWQKVADDTGGEFLLRIVLEQYGVSDYAAAADGWHGDRLRIYRHQKTGALGFYWAVRWDNTVEADDFYYSLGSHLPFVVELHGDMTFLSLALTTEELARLRSSLGAQVKTATPVGAAI